MIYQRRDEPIRNFARRIDIVFRTKYSEYCDQKTMRQFKRRTKFNWLKKGVSNHDILDLIPPRAQSYEGQLSWSDYVEALQDAEWHLYLLHPKPAMNPVRMRNRQHFEVDDDNYAIVYVGGACLNDGKNDAKGGVGVWFRDFHYLNLSAPLDYADYTNFNASQISAVIEAIKIAIDNDIERLSVYTSSRFVIDCMRRFLRKWLWNGWRRFDGELVRNRWQYRYLLELMEEITVKFIYIELNNPHTDEDDGRSEYYSDDGHDTENVSEEYYYYEYKEEYGLKYEIEYESEGSGESEEEDYDMYGVRMASDLANLAIKY